MQVMEWPAKLHGRFYSGDSYIILNTYHKKGQGALVWDIHFWIGKLSTQDEYGTAACKRAREESIGEQWMEKRRAACNCVY